MNRFQKYCLALGVVVAVLCGLVRSANAGYINLGGGAPSFEEFTVLSTAWDPGAGTARFGGNPAPGGATWSIMGAGLDLEKMGAGHGGNSTADFDSLLPVVGREAQIVDQTLNIWAAQSLFTNLGNVADGGGGAGASGAAGGVGDIRVAGGEINNPSVLAHAYQPGTPVQFTTDGNLGGDVHMDVNRTWNDNPNDVTGNGQFDFFTVMLHELGHSVGLGHSNVAGSVMEAVYAGSRRTLHADDIAGIQAIYGASEPPPAIPEPSSIVLLSIGALGFVAYGRRNRKTAA